MVPGMREWLAQADERNGPPRIPVMVNMTSANVPPNKSQKINGSTIHPSPSLNQINSAGRNSTLDEFSEEDEDFILAESEAEVQ